MKWLLVMAVVAIALGGCQNSRQTAQDPFFGRTTVPAPATGAAGARSCDPYYQPPAGSPLQPIPQPQFGTPPARVTPGYGTNSGYGTPTPQMPSPGNPMPGSPGYTPPATAPNGYPVSPSYPASPGYTPPANSSPNGYPASPGYGSPSGSGYQGSATRPEASAGVVSTPAPTPADSLGSAPSIVRIPEGSETAPTPIADRPPEMAADRTPIIRTLQPRPRDPATPASPAATGVAGPLTPTRAAPPGELMEITDLPTARNDSSANTARTGDSAVER